MHVYIHTKSHTCMHTYTQIHTHKITYTHILTHTYTHQHIYEHRHKHKQTHTYKLWRNYLDLAWLSSLGPSVLGGLSKPENFSIRNRSMRDQDKTRTSVDYNWTRKKKELSRSHSSQCLCVLSTSIAVVWAIANVFSVTRVFLLLGRLLEFMVTASTTLYQQDPTQYTPLLSHNEYSPTEPKPNAC